MAKTVRVGVWQVNAHEGWIARGRAPWRRRVRPDPRLMAVFRVLAGRAGELVTTDELLDAAWPDRVVSRDSVSSAIYELRRILGDDAAAPRYIRTEPRRGYRLIARVRHTDARRPAPAAAAAVAVGALLFAGIAWLGGSSATGGQPMLHITPLEDATGDSRFRTISAAIDATLASALISRHPMRVISAPPTAAGAAFRLDAKLVACDVGPALVVRLRAPESGRYLWSASYALADETGERTLVERIADDVTVALSDT